ncbi:MAG: PD-(D/E)XK nuclease family protein, partial [Chloroflexi bacterium]|nr:PD-(D/E)XK nuclease family protein [Chloroflexota bacterium]
MKTGYFDIDDAEYFGNYTQFLSASRLKEFARCPYTFNLYEKGLLSRPSSSAAQVLGTAAHCMILEGPEVFHERYDVADGPVNPKTGRCFGRDTKKYQDWLAGFDMPPIPTEDMITIEAMAASVFRNENLYLTIVAGKGDAEITARANILGVDCQGKL